MKAFLFIVLLLTASSVPAQEVAPRGHLIRLGVDTLAVFLVNGSDTTRTGTVLDEITFLESDGRRVLRRVYQSQDRVLGARVDTLVDDAATLAPISVQSRTSRSFEFIDFRNGQATGWMRLANGDSITVDASVDDGVFGSASFDLVLRSSPLRENWKAEVPAFLSSTRTVVLLHARVAGSEAVDGEPAWRIQADFGGTPVTFWIDKASRRLVRQLMQIRPDVAILFARPKMASVQPRHAT